MAVPQYNVNFVDASVVADPYPMYEEIRNTGRVVRNDLMGLWMVPGFDDCMEALTNPDRFAVMVSTEVTPWFPGTNMLMVDGAEHVRLRRCLQPMFTRQSTAAWERRVYEAVDEILAPAVEKRSFDIIKDFTMIPTVVVAEMMGIPRDRYEDFQHWSHTIVSNVSYGHEDPDVLRRLLDAGDQANGYLSEEIERHRQEEPDDLITAMLRSNMSGAEISSTALLLVLAGYDTTGKLLSNALVVLEQHADQREAIVNDLDLVPAAIEEVLRWAGVSHVDPRVVREDTELAGVKMSAGDPVYLLLACAGRDGGRWEDPLRFDIHREQKANLGFGFGSHLCLGMPLARLEAKAALERLLTLAPDYAVRDVGYGSGLNVRGPEIGYVEVNRG